MTVPGMSWWWWGRQPLAEGGQPSLQPPTAAEVGPRLTALPLHSPLNSPPDLVLNFPAEVGQL